MRRCDIAQLVRHTCSRYDSGASCSKVQKAAADVIISQTVSVLSLYVHTAETDFQSGAGGSEWTESSILEARLVDQTVEQSCGMDPEAWVPFP